MLHLMDKQLELILKSRSGGCYLAETVVAPFNKAKTTCATDNGFIATIHDDIKGYFLRNGKL